jgi:hypothetical protein
VGTEISSGPVGTGEAVPLLPGGAESSGAGPVGRVGREKPSNKCSYT